MAKRGWIYTEKDVHREWLKKIEQGEIGREWYLLIFRKKLKIVKEFLDKECKGKRILDVGCGEGILVEEYRKKGYDIEGVDPNYESDFVKIGEVTDLEYEDNSFDVILLLDVLEHIPYDKQYIALKEIKRVLKKGGLFLMSVPNLAAFSSRIKFLIFGKLSRADKDFNHVGERPFEEYKELLVKHVFKINKVWGITITLPLIWQLVTYFPQKMAPIHDYLLNCLNIPSLSLLNIFLAENLK